MCVIIFCFSLVCVQAKNIDQADSCKITPAKFSGSKEVVPLHSRKSVSSDDFWMVELKRGRVFMLFFFFSFG